TVCAGVPHARDLTTQREMREAQQMTTDVTNRSFEALGLSGETLRALNEIGFEEPTPIQIQAIPPMLAGRDLMAQAQTGTGKTAAFGLPIVERLSGQTRGPE